MDKPEGTPDDIWEMAEEISMNTANSYIGNTRAVAAAILKAKNDALEEAATLIDEGFYKTRTKPYREDGIPSKNDECLHGKYMYEDCEQCCSQAIRSLKHEG